MEQGRTNERGREKEKKGRRRKRKKGEKGKEEECPFYIATLIVDIA